MKTQINNGMSLSGYWPWKSIILIALAGFAAHGIVLFTDHLLWDGIVFSKHLKIAPVGWEVNARAWWESGRGYDLLWMAPMKGTANPGQWAKVLSVPAWILSSVFFYLFLLWSKKADPVLSLMAALLAVCAPFVDLLGDMLPYLYVMPVCFFWAGMAAFMAYPRQETKLRCALVRILSLALLFVSFSLPSNLVMFCGVFGLYLVFGASKTSLQNFVGDLWRQLKGYGDFALLPFVSWVIRRTCFPTYNGMEWYNSVRFDASRMLDVYGTALRSLWGKWEINAGLWWIWFLALVLALGVGIVVMRSKNAARGIGQVRAPMIFLVCGLLLWLAAVFPYASVGQYIQASGWSTRNAILFHVPLGCFLAGAIALVARLLLPARPRAAWLPVALVAGLGIGMANASYLRFQAQGAKQQVFAKAFRQQFSAQTDVSLVQLRDYFVLPNTFDFYPAYIWSQLGAPETEMPKTLVVDTGLYVPDQIQTDESGAPRRVIPELDVTTADLERLIVGTEIPYGLVDVPRRGRQFMTVITPGRLGGDAVGLGAQYLLTRYFRPEKLPDFLAGLAEIQFREIKPVQP